MNKALKAIIVDDEEDGRIVLKTTLAFYCTNIKVVALCASVDEALQATEKEDIDVVFLDVNMPVQNGFSFLEKCSKKNFEVIFVTAHENYAIKALRYAALDYLLKPIDPEELMSAVERVELSSKGQMVNKIDHFIENVNKEEIEQIILPLRDGYLFVIVNDIVRCQSDVNYTYVFMKNGEKHLVSKTLKDFESLLPRKKFFRIHKSHIINVSYIKKYTKGDGGTVTLLDGAELDVSRRKKEEFLQAFQL